MNYEMSGVNFGMRSHSLTTLFMVHIASNVTSVLNCTEFFLLP